MEHRLDPLGDLEVKRVLAFARAREQYPSVPRGLLLDYCQAAWQAAIAGGEEHDVVDRFERALMLVAWTHRRSPHVNFRELVDQVIPQVALKPFMAPADSAQVEEAPVAEPEPAAKRDAVRPPARRLIPRVPFASPIPLGAAVAAGFIGVTMLGQTGALPVAPFAPAGNDDASPADSHHHHGAAPASPHSTPAGGRRGVRPRGAGWRSAWRRRPKPPRRSRGTARVSAARASSAAKKASGAREAGAAPAPVPAPAPPPRRPPRPRPLRRSSRFRTRGPPSEAAHPSGLGTAARRGPGAGRSGGPRPLRKDRRRPHGGQ